MALRGKIVAISKGTAATVDDLDLDKAVEQFHVRGNPDRLYAAIGGCSQPSGNVREPARAACKKYCGPRGHPASVSGSGIDPQAKE